MSLKMSFKAGYVGLIGQPNAGKSTLLNAMVGDQVSIVTAKPQTTRNRIEGLVNADNLQICVVDSPGLIRAAKGLNKFLSREVESVISESDALIAVLNVDEDDPQKLEEVLTVVVESKKPWIAVITKTDLGLDHRVPLIRDMVGRHNGVAVSLSVVRDKDRALEQLLPHLSPLIPESEGPMFPLELYTTQNVRDMAAELIREQSFLHLHQEVPFGLAVRMRQFKEVNQEVRIIADLVVSRENHRPIVIGRGGTMIKAIGVGARQSIAKLVGQKVHLDLNVQVRKNWHQDDVQLMEFGYGKPNA